jgi:hypothetical protein
VPAPAKAPTPAPEAVRSVLVSPQAASSVAATIRHAANARFMGFSADEVGILAALHSSLSCGRCRFALDILAKTGSRQSGETAGVSG